MAEILVPRVRSSLHTAGSRLRAYPNLCSDLFCLILSHPPTLESHEDTAVR